MKIFDAKLAVCELSRRGIKVHFSIKMYHAKQHDDDDILLDCRTKKTPNQNLILTI